jgi:putative Holliday junction resolvase
VTAPPTKGRLLGLDYGTVRVGLAVTDPDRILASPLMTYARKSEVVDAAHLSRIVEEVQVVALVVGLPLHSDGRESEKSREARTFGAWLANLTALPVIFWDERFTTARAEDALISAKMNPRDRKERRDKVAAQLMLQDYLNAGCPEQGTEASSKTEDGNIEDISPR